MRFRDIPIQNKVILLMMFTCISALCIAGVIFFAVQVRNYNLELHQEVQSIATLLGATSQAAIEFDDQKAAEKILSVLREDSRIQSATLYNVKGDVFAYYQNAANPRLPGANEDGISYLSVKHPIHLNKKIIGAIKLEVDAIQGFYKRLGELALVALLTILASGMIAYIISRRLQRVISLPILSLSATAKKVSIDKDYSLRAEKQSNDEIGMLIDQFNEMLEQINKEDSRRQLAENELKVLNEELEQRVEERSEELRQSVEKLRRTERLASIGTLAAGMAHEIRNPINSISLAAQHALRYQKDLNPLQEKTLASIANEAQRCGTIVKNILLFAKSEKTLKSPEFVNDIIHKATVLARSYSASAKVEITTNLDPNAGKVPMNSTEIEQVIVNILNNAIEAKPADLYLEIKTVGYPDKVEISIRDDGPGIPEDAIGRIFDPFFSTKRKHGNTGLGLSLCHGIILEHQGFLNVKSKVGEGSTFSIELPRELK